MKCGTTTLHNILNEHPDVFIPESEIHFFDMDDLSEHPEFFFFNDDYWITPPFSEKRNDYWQWYFDFFKDAEEDQIIGEDSTGYLASKNAPARIASQKKDIKIIVLLRNPVDRTYSHYWHNVRAGRIGHSFENTLRFFPNTILRRSLYKQQLERYIRYIAESNLKIVVFEEFIKNKSETINDIICFLGLDDNKLNPKFLDIHSNKANMPLFPRLQLVKNRIHRDPGNWIYRGHFPDFNNKVGKKKFLPRLFNNLHNTLNPRIDKNPPPMKRSTRSFLNDYFIKELEGLDKLINKNVLRIWFSDNE